MHISAWMAENGVTIEQIGQKYDLTKETHSPDQGKGYQAFTESPLQQCFESIFGLITLAIISTGILS